MSSPKEGHRPPPQPEPKIPTVQRLHRLRQNKSELQIDKLARNADNPNLNPTERKKLVSKRQELMNEWAEREWSWEDYRKNRAAERKREDLMLKKTAKVRERLIKKAALRRERATEQIPAYTSQVGNNSTTQEENQQTIALSEYSLNGKTFSLDDIRRTFQEKETNPQIKQKDNLLREWHDIPYEETRVIDDIITYLYKEIYPNTRDRRGIKGKAFTKDKKAVTSWFLIPDREFGNRVSPLGLNQKTTHSPTNSDSRMDDHSASQEKNEQPPSLPEYSLNGKTFSLDDIREEYQKKKTYAQIEQEGRGLFEIPYEETRVIDNIITYLYKEIYPNTRDRRGIKGKAFTKDKKAVASWFLISDNYFSKRVNVLGLNVDN